MINLASPGFERSSLSVRSQFAGQNGPSSNQWLVSNPAVSSRYEFVGQPVKQLSAPDAGKDPVMNFQSEPRATNPLWQVALEGIFAAAFLMITFGFTAWMFFHVTFQMVSFGDLQFLDVMQQYFTS